MLLNFYQDQNLQTGKEIINAALAERSSGRIYISNFLDVNFQLPEDADEGEKVRFQRRVLFYRALLNEAGFGKPPQKEARLKGLFNEGMRKALRSGKGKDRISIRHVEQFWKRNSHLGRKLLRRERFFRNSSQQEPEGDFIKNSQS